MKPNEDVTLSTETLNCFASNVYPGPTIGDSVPSRLAANALCTFRHALGVRSTRYNLQGPEASFLFPHRPVKAATVAVSLLRHPLRDDDVRVTRVVRRLWYEDHMGIFPRPPFQVPCFINCYLVSVDNALVREEARPGDVPKLVII